MSAGALGWGGIVRLGLVQTCLGAIIVLTTSTLNRIMVVELALPAVLPGLLVGLHHAVQISRPHFGHGSDVGGRTSIWIFGGMSLLALGGVSAAAGTALAATWLEAGIAVCFLAFFAIGLGASAAGTSLLVTLAKYVDPGRKAAAATIVWIMMIAGFAVTASIAGHFLDPYSPARLVEVTAVVGGIAVLVTAAALYRLEPQAPAAGAAPAERGAGRFREAVRLVWREDETRLFTIFVFTSMLAYSFQDLILEPFAGTVFGMTPGESTRLAGVQHGGVLLGMLVVAVSSTVFRSAGAAALRAWTIGGCLASAAALIGLACGGLAAETWPLKANVFALGVANGAFAVGAIASMMTLASDGAAHHEGLRMGLWGAAQAIGFALGGFLGTVSIDLSRWLIGQAPLAYALVFCLEAMIFVLASVIGARVRQLGTTTRAMPRFTEVAMAEVLDGR